MENIITKSYQINEPYILFLGDCITSHIKSKFDKDNIINLCEQIQGGKNHQLDFEKINDKCKYIIIINSWANASSVIETDTLWNERMSVYTNILSSILKTNKSLLMIDRPGLLHHYWGDDNKTYNDYMTQLNLTGKLGIPKNKAIELGWKQPDINIQLERRKKHLEKLKNLIQNNNVTYIDIQNEIDYNLIHCKISAEFHHNVINNAPWHFDFPFNDYVYNIIKKYDEKNITIDDIKSLPFIIKNAYNKI